MPDTADIPASERTIERAAWVLPAHVAAVTLVQATQMAIATILGVLARKTFDASKFEVLLIQAAPVVLYVLSIFWNDLFARREYRRYLALYWLVASAPMLLTPLADRAWMLLVPFLVACVGGSGHLPVTSELLKKLYPSKSLARVYSLIWGIAMLLGAAASLGLGRWLNHTPDAFRAFVPLGCGLQLVGVVVMWRIAEATGLAREKRAKLAGAGVRAASGIVDRARQLLGPITHMGGVLKEDPVFARYEGAYMTYGAGWMIGSALLPLLVVDRLHLRYDEISESTQVAYQVAVVAAMFPAGWLSDRWGAVRSAGLSFVMLAGYPIGLLLARDAHGVLAASLWYGLAHAGATVGWMLGPVALAPTPEKAPTYVAIHATLVGFRGAIFQSLGVLLYGVTGRFDLPLALAAGAYVWGGAQMFVLHRKMRRGTVGAPARAPGV